ncbi:MAG: T9SS type A sorting domain-containing protein, partial [Candidatus Marinimicrobia bacterium]|nr:T9SS type A sorting domain-containing protein [Candidatus Neomarinimicrobiota bacterium]
AWFDDFTVEKMVISPPTAVEPGENLVNTVPEDFMLLQNYPNPFNPETTIEYALPHASKVNISIYNVLGQKIRTLSDTKKIEGYYKVIWDGKNDRGEIVPTGIYLYVLTTDKSRFSKKMVLIR